jgi:hypothetical protein
MADRSRRESTQSMAKQRVMEKKKKCLGLDRLAKSIGEESDWAQFIRCVMYPLVRPNQLLDGNELE